MEHLRAAAAPGSYLVVSHATNEGNPRLAAAAEKMYNAGAADGQARSRAEILRFFGDWELAEPGLVTPRCGGPARQRTCPANPEQFWFLAGLARKPEPERT